MTTIEETINYLEQQLKTQNKPKHTKLDEFNKTINELKQQLKPKNKTQETIDKLIQQLN